MSDTEQAAAETVHTFMKYILYGKFDEAGEMIIGDVETMGLPANGENETIIYSILGTRDEKDAVVVPVEMEMEAMGDRVKQTVSFACVEREGSLKIDMDLTLRKTMGASPDDLLASVKESLEGAAEETESCFEKIPEEELAPELYSPEYLSDAFRGGMGRIEELFDDDVESISDLLDNEDVAWQIAWGTMCVDEQCPQRLLSSVISPLRAALSMLEDHRSEDPDAARDASIGKIRANIGTIRIINANDHRLCDCTLEDGRLTLMPCLMPTMDNPAVPTVGFTADRIERAIRDALDLDVGPAIRRTEKAVTEFIGDCREDFGFTPEVIVDRESFRSIGCGRKAVGALKRLRNDLFQSVYYAMFHLRKKVSFDACLKSLRFRHVESAGERSITADGTAIVFSVPLVEARDSYTTEQVQELLGGLVRELPDSPREEGTPAGGFEQMVASMESDMMGPMRAQMSQLFGKEFGLEVDWDSMDGDEDHFTLVVSGAMGAVMGALMAMAFDAATKEPVTSAVGAIAMRYDPAVRGVALSLDGGVLTVACGGPASEYAPDSQAMGEVIMTLLTPRDEASPARQERR